jgi:hypothetical protein
MYDVNHRNLLEGYCASEGESLVLWLVTHSQVSYSASEGESLVLWLVTHSQVSY